LSDEHLPVLCEETIEAVIARRGDDSAASGVYVDATFGRGGHAPALLYPLGSPARLIAVDRDPAARQAAAELTAADPRVSFQQARFSELERVLDAHGADRVSGVIMDLGVSSPQLDDPARGFSFLRDGPLDMRMDPDVGESAADWLARAEEREIADVIFRYGEDRHARRIARALVASRSEAPIRTTARLAEIVGRAVPRREPGKHPATRTFQALRIHVNGELEEIAAALPQAVERLAPGGRVVVISFHSLEDRLVKRFLRNASRDDPAWAGLPEVPAHARARLRLVGHAVFPSPAEVERNPRSRSAVLRAAERLAA
jgi:16S rRNA (cytosine1402-N4)-methyltransferase